jgi:hypothetical protein
VCFPIRFRSQVKWAVKAGASGSGDLVGGEGLSGSG